MENDLQANGTIVEHAMIMIITLGRYSNPMRKRKDQPKQRREKEERCKKLQKQNRIEQFNRGELFGRKETNDMEQLLGKRKSEPKLRRPH